MFSRGSHASTVFHHFANRVSDYGRRSDGRVFFDGNRFYSYGRHYVAAYRLPEEFGGAILLNDSKYSPTTSGHVSAVASAASHLPRIRVPHLNELVSGWPNYDRQRQAVRLHFASDIGRTNTRRFVERHIRDLSEDAAKALLQLAGLSEARAAARAATLKAAAAKADEKLAIEQARAARIVALKQAKFSAAMSQAEFVAWLDDFYGHGESAVEAQIVRYKGCASELRRLQIVANKETRGFVKVVARLKEQQKFIKAELAKLEASAAMRIRHMRTRALIAAVKTVSRPANDKAFTLYAFSEAARAARKLAANRRTRAETSFKLARFAEKLEAAQEMHKALEAREQIRARAAAIETWRNGTGPTPHGANDGKGGALLRAVKIEMDANGEICGGLLQTSQGAEVPLTHAIRAFRFVKLCRDNGRTWHKNGHSIRVGHYTLDSISPEGNFKAGCHRINWPEIERLARALGVFDMPANDSALIETAH